MGIFSLFRRSAPPTVPTDRIIPLREWDDLDYLRSLCHDFTFRFDDVLDASKLEAALGRLMKIGEWRQMGARLRLNARGRLEYHIPARYDNERPAFIFTTSDFKMDIADHPVGSCWPKSSEDHTHVSPPSEFFSSIVRHPDSPRRLADWIYTDRPQLHIHVSLFQDATLLTMSCIHTFTDAVSRLNFFNAWIAVLRGHAEEVPAFVPYDRDPLGTLGRTKSGQSHRNFSNILSGFRLAVFGFWLIWEQLWYSKLEEHLVRLPGRALDRTRERILQDLASEVPKASGKLFVSEGDMVVAWWVRTMVKALNPATDRAVTVMNVFNVWDLFPEEFSQNAAGFMGNAFSYSYTQLVAGKVLGDTTLRYGACASRKALTEHRTKQQVEAMTCIQRDNWRRVASVVGDSSSLFLAVTNHQKARYFDTDWSAAVVAPGIPLNERLNALGQPSFINYIEYSGLYPSRNVVRMIGKDAAGDWHLLFKTRAQAWPAIHRELRALESEQHDS